MSKLVFPFTQSFVATTGAVGGGWKMKFTLTSAPTTLVDTFTDKALTVPHTNPVVADSSGRFPDIYGTVGVEYLITLMDESDITVASSDNNEAFTTGTTAATAITYTASGASTVERTVSSKLDDFRSVLDYGALGDDATNNTPALTLALQSARRLWFPNGDYIINTSVPSGLSGLHLVGESKVGVRIKFVATDGTGAFALRSAGVNISRHIIENMTIDGGGVATGGAATLEDVSDFLLDNVDVIGFDAAPTTNYGVSTTGHDRIHIRGGSMSGLRRPVIMRANPNSATAKGSLHLENVNWDLDDVAGIAVDILDTNLLSIIVDGDSRFSRLFRGIQLKTTGGVTTTKVVIDDLQILDCPTAAARAVLTFTGNPTNETFTIRADAYQFVGSLSVAGDILIGADLAASLVNAAAALNQDTGSGTLWHSSTPAQTDAVKAFVVTDTKLCLGGGSANGSTIAIATTGAAVSIEDSRTTLLDAGDVGYAVFLDGHSSDTIETVHIDGLHVPVGLNGIYARNCGDVIMTKSTVSGGYGHYSIESDDTVDNLVADRSGRGVGATERLPSGGLLLIGEGAAGLEVYTAQAADIKSIRGASAVLGGALDVAGTSTLATLNVTGAATVNSLNVTTATAFTNSVTIATTLGVTGATILSNNLDVAGNATMGGTMGITGNTTVGGTLVTTGASTFNSAVTVNSSVTISNSSSCAGNFTIGGTAICDAAVTVGTTLNVTGATTLAAATVNSTLVVTGTTTLNSNVTVNSSVTITNSSTCNGNFTIGGTGTLAAATITNNATVGGTLGVTGVTTLASTTVGGSLTVNSTSSFGDDVIMTDALDVTDRITGGGLRSTGNTYVEDNLIINNKIRAGTAASNGPGIIRMEAHFDMRYNRQSPTSNVQFMMCDINESVANNSSVNIGTSGVMGFGTIFMLNESTDAILSRADVFFNETTIQIDSANEVSLSTGLLDLWLNFSSGQLRATNQSGVTARVFFNGRYFIT